MGAKKKYTGRSLLEAVDGYFSSIRRTVEATERVETDAKHFIEQPILSDSGEPIRYREYVVPPTLWGLCEYLGITPRTWARYCDRTKHPEMQEAVLRAGALMQEWKEQALLTRKDVRGIIYHIQNNMGGLELPEDGSEALPLSLSMGEKRAILIDELAELRDGAD